MFWWSENGDGGVGVMMKEELCDVVEVIMVGVRVIVVGFWRGDVECWGCRRAINFLEHVMKAVVRVYNIGHCGIVTIGVMC